ncbi:MAG: L,D-transpeptidase family protein [Myxococcota bacterium]|nr:L,D-transpeptidase family protein [Myxococcota bacterium]
MRLRRALPPCLLLAALGCATAGQIEELQAELRGLRLAAWDAQRAVHRAEAFAEAAERAAAEARAAGASGAALAGHEAPTAAHDSLARADHVRVHKRERRLQLLRSGVVLREFRVALGFEPVGHKQREGDGRTPEGTYSLSERVETRRFGRALRISYPNEVDVRRARRAGVAPGGGILIHGLPVGAGLVGRDHAKFDWTNGCIAVTDEELEEIWARVGDGTPIEILP